MKLNPSQEQAVMHRNSPLLIVAGAGTGKTTVLTQRIRHLIESDKIDPQQIFATTFTEKSAAELLSRLDMVMPLGYREPWIGTFHSLCDRILRQEALEVGMDPNFQIMTQTDQWIFFKKHLFDFPLEYYRPLGNPNKFIDAILKFFSRLQDEAISSEAFFQLANEKMNNSWDEASETDAHRLHELALAYQYYVQLKTQESLLDFGDLINKTLDLFRTRPNLVKKFREQFSQILVDEFQDTNYAQFELIQLLAPAKLNPNLVVVGDDDQAIYKFRGASISNILQFKELYPQAKEIVLLENYRSTQLVLDAAYQSIVTNNPDRLEVKLNLDKKLAASNPQRLMTNNSSEPKVLQFKTVDEEVAWTIQRIVLLVTTTGISYKDIAILTRSNAQLQPYAVALRQAGLPFQLVSNRGLFDRPEVSVLLSWLHLLADPNDVLALLQVVQIKSLEVDAKRILELIRDAKRLSTSVWEVMRLKADHDDKVNDEEWFKSLNHLRQLIEEEQVKATELAVSQLLHGFIVETEFLQQFTMVESIENTLAIKNINLFFEKIRHYERVEKDHNFLAFLETLDLWIEAGENPGQAQLEDVDTISLMTVHAAKGLEFDAVFIGSVVMGRFPSTNRKDPIAVPDELVKETLPVGDIHIQEERRLFYVAMTRAKQYLYITLAEDYGGSKKWKVSGFVRETGLQINSEVPDPDLTALIAGTPAILQEPRAIHLQGDTFKMESVSYSQLTTFASCPLQFKYRYWLQIPTQPHHSRSFGQSLHSTLHQFHQREMQGQLLTKLQLLELYQANFINEGYDSAKHKQARFDAGKLSLEHYFDFYSSLLDKPVLLEQPFKLQLGDTTLLGKIDRVEQNEQGQYAIIDYKTGAAKSQKEVDKDEQLTIYALAAQEALQLPVEKLSLFFIESGKIISTTRTPEQLAKAKTSLLKQIQTIKQSDFKAKPGSPMPCDFCDYKHICPVVKK